jgi:hypothetical protein
MMKTYIICMTNVYSTYVTVPFLTFLLLPWNTADMTDDSSFISDVSATRICSAHHHEPIIGHTPGAQAFLMDYT